MALILQQPSKSQPESPWCGGHAASEMKETMIVSLEISLVHNIRAVTSEGDRVFSDKPLVTTIDHSQNSNPSLP
jgi:hypothetical protein